MDEIITATELTTNSSPWQLSKQQTSTDEEWYGWKLQKKNQDADFELRPFSQTDNVLCDWDYSMWHVDTYRVQMCE